MSGRLYAVQIHDYRGGWKDYGVYSAKEKKCNDVAKAYAKANIQATRTIRKPKGFVPFPGSTIF